ncbi:MAG: hypothetical protein ACYCQJ_01965 [Nitrososphaerales archaeon]
MDKTKLGFISDAMLLMKTGNFERTAKLLESHLSDSDLKPSAKIGIMAWIADCYLKIGDQGRAARWLESAGKAALDCKDIPAQEKKRRALDAFERALGCYEIADDLKGMGRMASLKYGLIES